MTRYYLLVFFLMLSFRLAYAQAPVRHIYPDADSNRRYVNFVMTGDTLWALTAAGQIKTFDLRTCQAITLPADNDTGIITITKDWHENIVVGDNRRAIKLYNSASSTWTTLFRHEAPYWDIVFDHNNTCYLTTPSGLFGEGHYYLPRKSKNTFYGEAGQWTNRPKTYVDNNGRIWLGFGYGEWGGELRLFDPATKKELPLTGYPAGELPVQSIFTANDEVIVTTGLMHMMFSGAIVKYIGQHATPLLARKTAVAGNRDTAAMHNLYIGPGAFNPLDHCIYFYCNSGIYKFDVKADLQNTDNFKNVATPKLHWSDGQADAVGSPMNVSRMQFTGSGQLIFLTELDGIGIWTGTQMIMLH